MRGTSRYGITGPDSETVLVRFNQTPTANDRTAIEAAGGRITGAVNLVNGLGVRAGSESGSFDTLPGVIEVLSLGDADNPEVSVFITMSLAANAADEDHVRNANAIRWHIRDEGMSVVIRLDDVDRLGAYARFEEFEVVPATNTVQGCVNTVC